MARNASEWIELYNGSSRAVSLAGWCLTDDPGDLAKWSFPAGTQLVPNGYLVVFASGRPVEDSVDKAGRLHANFSLNKDGEYLALIDPSGAVVHEYSPGWPPQETDISDGLWRGTPCNLPPPPRDRPTSEGSGPPRQVGHSQEQGSNDARST